MRPCFLGFVTRFTHCAGDFAEKVIITEIVEPYLSEMFTPARMDGDSGRGSCVGLPPLLLATLGANSTITPFSTRIALILVECVLPQSSLNAALGR